MPGAFDASPNFDHDALRTAEEIQRSGVEVLRWLEMLAVHAPRRPIDLALVYEIHERWFESTFPADAGHQRTQTVLNRKSTAVAVDAIMPGVASACGNWNWRRENVAPDDDLERVRFVVSEANTLAVAVYDVHPFIDGNTRTTWHLRNYALMRDGLRPLTDLRDEARYEDAWWAATAHDHDHLDEVVLDELAADDRL